MFDLNILCVGQKIPTVNISENTNISADVANADFKNKEKRYYCIAPFMNYVDGIWYELLCSKDEIAGTSICDYIDNNETYPYWVNSTQIKCDLRTLVINMEYLSSFKKILRFLVDESPIKTILLFCRYQSNEAEVICGTCKF